MPPPRYPALAQLLTAEAGPSKGGQARSSLGYEKNPGLNSQEESPSPPGPFRCRMQAMPTHGEDQGRLGALQRHQKLTCMGHHRHHHQQQQQPGEHGGSRPHPSQHSHPRSRPSPRDGLRQPGEETPLFIGEGHAPTQATRFKLEQSHLTGGPQREVT